MDMDTTLTLILSELKGMNQRMSSMEGKITSMETRMNSMEGKIASMETRMNSMESKIASMETRMDSMESKIISMDNRMDSMENKMISMDNRMDFMESKMASMDNRMDRLERGQDEIKSNLADLTEQVKENTRFIRALVDGQTVLETKLSTLDETFQQLSSRTKKLERTSGGILYELAIHEDDLC